MIDHLINNNNSAPGKEGKQRAEKKKKKPKKKLDSELLQEYEYRAGLLPCFGYSKDTFVSEWRFLINWESEFLPSIKRYFKMYLIDLGNWHGDMMY